MKKKLLDVLVKAREEINETKSMPTFEYCKGGCHCAVGYIFKAADIDMEFFKKRPKANHQTAGNLIREHEEFELFKGYASHLGNIQDKNDDHHLPFINRKANVLMELDLLIEKIKEEIENG